MAKKTARKFYRLPEFSEAVKAGILPAYVNTWGPAHRAVIEQMYNQACFADNVGKVVVQEAPCGSGKSTLADGITRLSGVEKLINMILMTDSNKRLSDDTRTRQRERGLSLKLLIILEITVIRKPAERLSMQVRTMVRLTLREFPDYGLSVNIRKRCSFIHG